jgi:uracil-DNA glycosylase
VFWRPFGARKKRGPVILVSSEARFRIMLAGLRPGLARNLTAESLTK